MEFRIAVRLDNFFKDYRASSRLFITNKMKTIQDLKNHISKIFQIDAGFYIVASNLYLPNAEDVRVLKEDDTISVIPCEFEALAKSKDSAASKSGRSEPTDSLELVAQSLSVQKSNKKSKLKRKISNECDTEILDLGPGVSPAIKKKKSKKSETSHEDFTEVAASDSKQDSIKAKKKNMPQESSSKIPHKNYKKKSKLNSSEKSSSDTDDSDNLPNEKNNSVATLRSFFNNGILQSKNRTVEKNKTDPYANFTNATTSCGGKQNCITNKEKVVQEKANAKVSYENLPRTDTNCKLLSNISKQNIVHPLPNDVKNSEASSSDTDGSDNSTNKKKNQATCSPFLSGTTKRVVRLMPISRTAKLVKPIRVFDGVVRSSNNEQTSTNSVQKDAVTETDEESSSEESDTAQQSKSVVTQSAGLGILFKSPNSGYASRVTAGSEQEAARNEAIKEEGRDKVVYQKPTADFPQSDCLENIKMDTVIGPSFNTNNATSYNGTPAAKAEPLTPDSSSLLHRKVILVQSLPMPSPLINSLTCFKVISSKGSEAPLNPNNNSIPRFRLTSSMGSEPLAPLRSDDRSTLSTPVTCPNTLSVTGSPVPLSADDGSVFSACPKKKRKRVRHRKKKVPKCTNLLPVPTVTNGIKPFVPKAEPALHIRFEENAAEVKETAAEEGKTEFKEEVESVETVISVASNDINYEKLCAEEIIQFPPMEHVAPQKGDVIAFKIYTLSEQYTPEISNFIIGVVLKYDSEARTVLVKILVGKEQCIAPNGKFHLEVENCDNNDEQDERQFEWNELIEPRLLFP